MLQGYVASGYLLHGSQVKGIRELEPRITDGRTETEAGIVYPEDMPAISATDNIDIAIFTATVWKRGSGSSGWYSTYENGVAKATFNATEGVIRAALEPEAYGYVYVLPRRSFSRSQEMPAELRSYRPVVPVAVVRVHATDLCPSVDTLKPDPDIHH